MLMNKRNSLHVQASAYDIVRNALWRQAEVTKEASKKKGIERQLLNLDDSLAYNFVHLHDVIQGKDAQFIKKLRSDRHVLLGYEVQAIYFSLEFEDIYKLAEDCKAFEKELEAGEQQQKAIKEKEDSLIQIKQMLQEGLIKGEDAERYIKDLKLPEEVDLTWLKERVQVPQQNE